MLWLRSYRADPTARVIADRHYNRQKIGAKQFVPPGRCLVLLDEASTAYWVTSWPLPEYTKHAWPGAWVCSAFRNNGALRSSDMIRDAVAATRAEFGASPSFGMVTFVDETKVRHKRDPGRCFLRAGFTRLKERTKDKNLVVLQMLPDAMPEPARALERQLELEMSL